MTSISAAKPLVMSLSAGFAEWRPKEFDLRMNEYPFILIRRDCPKPRTCNEAAPR